MDQYNSKQPEFYRDFRKSGRRPAPGEVGTIYQQMLAVGLFVSAQDEQQRIGDARERLWTVCHCIATESPIPMEGAKQ